MRVCCEGRTFMLGSYKELYAIAHMSLSALTATAIGAVLSFSSGAAQQEHCKDSEMRAYVVHA